MPSLVTASMVSVIIVASIIGWAHRHTRRMRLDAKKTDEDVLEEFEIVVDDAEQHKPSTSVLSHASRSASVNIETEIKKTDDVSQRLQIPELVNRRQYVRSMCSRFERQSQGAKFKAEANHHQSTSLKSSEVQGPSTTTCVDGDSKQPASMDLAPPTVPMREPSKPIASTPSKQTTEYPILPVQQAKPSSSRIHEQISTNVGILNHTRMEEKPRRRSSLDAFLKQCSSNLDRATFADPSIAHVKTEEKVPTLADGQQPTCEYSSNQSEAEEAPATSEQDEHSPISSSVDTTPDEVLCDISLNDTVDDDCTSNPALEMSYHVAEDHAQDEPEKSIQLPEIGKLAQFQRLVPSNSSVCH